MWSKSRALLEFMRFPLQLQCDLPDKQFGRQQGSNSKRPSLMQVR